VLDLDSPVELEEVEVAAVEHELDRAGAPVAQGLPECDRGLAHARAQFTVERRRRRLLEHLLVPTLDRAFSFPERGDGSMLVGEELDLDVPWPLDVALAVDTVVAERGLGLAARGFDQVLQLGSVADDPHPAAAASGSRLDDQRKADLVRLARRKRRNAGLDSDPLGLELVPTLAQRLGRWPDEGEPGRLDSLREVRVLGEKAVARVDRVCSSALRRANVLFGEEVARHLGGLVRVARVEGAEIVGRRDRDRPDSGLAAGAEDAGRDLAAVRYEELRDRHRTANVIRDAPASVR
jgi:hypothetical protein